MRLFPQILRNADGGAGGGAGGQGGQQAGGQGGQQGGGQQGGGQQAGGGASWRDSLADDLRGNPVLAGFKSVGDLAKEHVNLQGLIGRKGVIPPGDKASDADWEKFYGELGRPESPDKYDLKGVEVPKGVPWNDTAAKRLAAAAHKAGLSPRQFRGLLAAHLENQATAWNEHGAREKERRTQAAAELRREWGGKFDERTARANEVMRHFAGAKAGDLDGLTLADGSRLLDHPVVARLFAAVGEAFGESGALPGHALSFGPGGPRAEIDQIRAEAAKDPKHPYNDSTHPDHRKVQGRVQFLYNQLGAGGTA